jgi:hypothetical protein
MKHLPSPCNEMPLLTECIDVVYCVVAMVIAGAPLYLEPSSSTGTLMLDC